MQLNITLPSIAFILSFIYLLVAIYLSFQREPRKKRPSKLPRVAVLIAMRDEETQIRYCLESVVDQDYPTELFDVFVLNDRSTDASAEIVRQFAKSIESINLIEIKEDKYGLQGKMNVLCQGIEMVDHDIICITDADCIVPETWISTHVNFMQDEVGMVGCLTMLMPTGNIDPPGYKDSIWARLQAFDWLFLQELAAATSNAGKPVTILGNNFSFRRHAYEQVGGFREIGFSFTEDFALMQALENTGQWRIVHTLDKLGTIFSYPLSSLKDFIQQRLRWVRGGRSARPWGYFIIGLAFFLNLSLIISLLLQGQPTLTITAFIVSFLSNFLIWSKGSKRFGFGRLKLLFPVFHLFYMIYTVFFGIAALVPLKVRWKNRVY